MRISDVMTPDVRAIALDRTVRDAARLMDEHDSTHLVVTTGGQPAGVISSLDIAGALAWGRA